MADSVQVKVNLEELEIGEKRLQKLSKSIANRRVNLQFTEEKGAVADNLLLAAKQLNEVGTTLADLIQKTEMAVTNTRVSFINADEMSAQWFGPSEG